jgi:2-keto-4-pentenoate hydratase
VDGAYIVQTLNTDFWINQGRRVVGHKIGLTSVAVQRQLGLDQPDFGVLFEDMEIASGGMLDPSRLIQPKVEAEVSLILARDVTAPNATPSEVMAATDCATVAIEIVDSRIADWRISLADTVADNGSSAFFVLGDERKDLLHLDLYTCGMVLEIDGAVASVGAGAACLGHPLNAATWLARTLAQRGRPLRAGEVILTGALGPMAPLLPGSEIRAMVGGLGSVGFSVGK